MDKNYDIAKTLMHLHDTLPDITDEESDALWDAAEKLSPK